MDEQDKDQLVAPGINSMGYGNVPKLVMKDRRLPVQAKAIYAYFCSYAGNGTTAFPTVSTIIYDLKISKDTYSRMRKLLVQYGYLKVDQKRGAKGTFAQNIYTLCTEIIEIKGDSEPQPKPSTPDTVEPSTATPITDTTVSDETDTNNNSYINNNNNNINRDNNNNSQNNYYNVSQSVGQSSNQDTKKESSQTFDNLKEPSHKNFITNYNSYKVRIQENISYKSYLEYFAILKGRGDVAGEYQLRDKIKLIDDFVNIMLDAIFSKGDLKIGNELKSREMVENIYLELNNNHLEFAYNNFINTTSKIKNKKAYIQTTLYNSYFEFRADVENFMSMDR